MKIIIKLFLTFFMLTAFNSFVKAQTWVALSSPTTQSLLSVFFLNKDTGFVGGGSSTSGLLYKTTDGGNSWNSITVPTTYFINKICFLTKDSGYFFTGNTQLYKTTNGGNSWTYIRNLGSYGTSNLSNSGLIYFQNSSIGFIRGTNYIWRTLNGGASWDSTNIAPTGSALFNWYEINFISPTIGYTSNMTGSIWKTTNQGASWSLNSTLASYPNQLLDFTFFNSNLGIAFNNFSNLLKTNNGGTSWSSIGTSISSSSHSKISFTSNNRLFMFSSSGIYTSNDTGNTWSQMTISPYTSNLYDWFMINDSVGYAVGSGTGLIYKTFPGAVAAPTTAASTFFIGGVTNTSMVLNWTNGNGSSRIVVACAGSNTLIAPSYGVSYSAGSFGSGSQMGTGNYVVYNGTGNSCTVSGLSLNTAYYYRVYEYNGIGTNSNYLTSTFATNGAMTLPVKLISFNATVKNDVVNLNWQTASELNNDYFEIERSIDNRQWTKVGKVKGNGTTNVVSNYQFTDLINPSTNQPINIYYRLKQVDFDGKSTLSEERVVNFKQTNTYWNIYPNPATNELHIETLGNEKFGVQLFDVTGKKVMENVLIINNTNINTSSLYEGMYFVRIINADGVVLKMQKITVVR